MRRLLVCAGLLLGSIAQASGATPVTVVDFSKAPPRDAKTFAADKRDSAAISVSKDQPLENKQTLKLHYKFAGEKGSVGLNIPVKIYTPIHKVRLQVYGDGSGCTYAVMLTDASGKRGELQLPPPDQAGSGIGKANADAGGEAKQLGQSMKVDFKGWKEIVLDVDASKAAKPNREKFNFPFYSQITFELRSPGKEATGDLYLGALTVDSDVSAEMTLSNFVTVTSPEYCSDIKGDTTVELSAPWYKEVTVRCWQQGEGYGKDTEVATVKLNDKGMGSFVFPADKYPHGPIILRIFADNGTLRDKASVQFYNKGGVSWNEGAPKETPAPAKGMKLVFVDDFDGPMSISKSDPKATYYSHKAPNGTTDFSVHTFSDAESPKNPFAQFDGYLRIRASDKLKSSGLISSIKNDGSGITARAPCYFESRFIAQSAIGAWPAWWLMTNYQIAPKGTGSDEIDIFEGYGGHGPGHPNFDYGFMITPHRWSQGQEGKDQESKAFKAVKNPDHFKKAGIPSSWCEAFHTYGCKITETDTIYYIDNIEVARHETFPNSKVQPIFFFVNLATGGGWPVDISRYGNIDMYVDFVRVYEGEAAPATTTKPAN